MNISRIYQDAKPFSSLCDKRRNHMYLHDREIKNYRNVKLGEFLSDERGIYYYVTLKSEHTRKIFNMLAYYVNREGGQKDDIIKFGSKNNILSIIWNGVDYRSCYGKVSEEKVKSE